MLGDNLKKAVLIIRYIPINLFELEIKRNTTTFLGGVRNAFELPTNQYVVRVYQNL